MHPQPSRRQRGALLIELRVRNGLPGRSPVGESVKSVFALCASTRQPSPAVAQQAKAGAVAGNCTRTCSVAGSHSAVKSQPRKLKGPEVSLHFRPMPFQQRTNTSWRSIRSQPAVSRRLFRCLGAHLLRSPLNVKFVSLFPAVRSPVRGHTTSVTIQSSSSPNSTCRQKTSSRCRAFLVHRLFIFR